MAQITLSYPNRADTNNPEFFEDTNPPLEKQGPYRIQKPTYDGVDQLTVLDKNWVIVHVNTLPALFDYCNTASGGELEQYLETSTYWNHWDIIDDNFIDGRKAVGELDMKTTGYYSITSSDDSNYTTSQNPSLVDSVYQACGGYTDDSVWFKDRGIWRHNYRIANFIKFPTPLVADKTYTITLSNGDSVTFTFDRYKTVSRAIKVNQIGYLPSSGKKRAYLGAYAYKHGPVDFAHATSVTFEVVNAETGEIAHTGTPALIEANPTFSDGSLMYGEDVYEMDFTSMTDTGTFFISVPGVGRSWPFIHDTNAYTQAGYTSVRHLFYQRSGHPAESQYTRWPKPLINKGKQHFRAGHAGVGNQFDAVAGSIDFNRPVDMYDEHGQGGGYHDAADYDCNFGHLLCGFDMMFAYEFNSANFTDNQFNIPESGNGVPDILSEVRHGLEYWRKISVEDGGCGWNMDTWTHPPWHHTDTTPGNIVGHRGRYDYGISRSQRYPSAIFAAAAAQYARLVAPFDTADSNLYKEAALASYEFAKDNINDLGTITIDCLANRGDGDPYTVQYTEDPEKVDAGLIFAKCQLFLLTNDQSYITGDPESLLAIMTRFTQLPYQWTSTHAWGRKDWAPWIYYSVIQAHDAGATGLASKAAELSTFFIDDADALEAAVYDAPYANCWPRNQNYWAAWGNTTMTHYNRGLEIAYQLTGDNKYRTVELLNLDFMYGCNPMGTSWTTGIGAVNPINIQHGLANKDNILGPPPGTPIYGITGAPIYLRFREEIWEAHKEARKQPGYFVSLTQVSGTATAVSTAHGLETGDNLVIYSADQEEYNGYVTITVIDADTFTYPVEAGAPSPATANRLVFSHSGIVGTLTEGATVTGATSLATGTIIRPVGNSNITILPTSGTFVSGEQVYVTADVNYVVITNDGSPVQAINWTYNFVTESTHRSPPWWRRMSYHNGFNTGQCEWTVHETASANIFAMMVLLENEPIKELFPRQREDLYGFWYLP